MKSIRRLKKYIHCMTGNVMLEEDGWNHKDCLKRNHKLSSKKFYNVVDVHSLIDGLESIGKLEGPEIQPDLFIRFITDDWEEFKGKPILQEKA